MLVLGRLATTLLMRCGTRCIVVTSFTALVLAATATDATRGPSTPSNHVTLASTTTSLADGTNTTVGLPNGITVTVPPGWTIISTGPTWVLVLKADKSTEMQAASGRAVMPDINQESAYAVSQYISMSGYTNVVQVAQPVQTVQGNHFNQALKVNFTADSQSSQGALQLWGFYVTLYDTAAQNAGAFWVAANSPDTLQAATPDAEAMLGSML
jgi:hypothetical protein